MLTPGPYNSAYFEHSFLARTMGLELVQAPDLFVDDDKVFCRTTRGPRRVDVIYRRTDEAFLDPEVFRPDSVLGVPGLMRAYAAGNVALANAPGNGVADDKAVYPFVPEMIQFYLGEEPLLEQVPTYVCLRDDDREYVLEHLDEMVVKAVDEAGGYGMLMGPQSTAEQRDEFRRRIIAEPRRYIAQHRVELSSCPTWIGERSAVEPRRVDLRPVHPDLARGPVGAARRARRASRSSSGSYVVNSSQGGGSKDTWVHEGDAHDLARRRSLLLVRPLRRARRGDRAHAVRDASLALDAELPPAQVWRPVVVVSGEEDEFRARSPRTTTISRRGATASSSSASWCGTRTNGVSLARSISGARWNARSIREVLSLEAWEAVNELHLWMRSDEAQREYAQQREASTSTCAASTQLTLGLLRSTMLHDEPLDFIWLGVLLERVSQTARMLDVHHHAFTNLPQPRTRSSRPRCGCRCCARCRAPRRT